MPTVKESNNFFPSSLYSVPWDQAIVGKSVGSRLLLSIPPEKGYGKAGNPRAGIRGTDTLVFVVDILGVR